MQGGYTRDSAPALPSRHSQIRTVTRDDICINVWGNDEVHLSFGEEPYARIVRIASTNFFVPWLKNGRNIASCYYPTWIVPY